MLCITSSCDDTASTCSTAHLTTTYSPSPLTVQSCLFSCRLVCMFQVSPQGTCNLPGGTSVYQRCTSSPGHVYIAAVAATASLFRLSEADVVITQLLCVAVLTTSQTPCPPPLRTPPLLSARNALPHQPLAAERGTTR